MSSQGDRLRQHPTERFRPNVHQIDLSQAAAQLQAEGQTSQRGHRQTTLYRHAPVTVALFVFEAGAHMASHAADGVVTIHVLEGRLRMNAEDEMHDLSAGQILVLAPGVKHDVHAETPSRMLLTICLDSPKSVM